MIYPIKCIELFYLGSKKLRMGTFSSKNINKAYDRIKHLILKTPLITNETINKKLNAKIFFKLENLQWTGSFKLRGAIHKISLLKEDEKNRGVVAFSSGNHAQAVSYASKIFGISATIVMPKDAPEIKINNTKNYGAKVVLYDQKNENREDIAFEIANKEKKFIIKPYDDLEIIAGQGTAGKEIYEDLNLMKIKPDLYLCCCGGGGLIAGTSTYLKENFQYLKAFSVEPQNFNDTQISLQKKIISKNKIGQYSICDALLAEQPGNITFPINQKNLSGGLVVSDKEVKETILYLAENLKIVCEPGGAVAATALLNNKIDVERKNIIVMISGGNLDIKFFENIINRK